MPKLVKNSLGFDSHLFLYQDKEMFNYSVDTIMLGNFVTINKSVKSILDIGANNGALSIFVAERKKDLKIDALEIQKESVDLAKKNVNLNNMQNKISVIHDDFNNFYKLHTKKEKDKYDAIVCNPPFYKYYESKRKKVSIKFLIATHEIKINLEQIIAGSAKILKQKGYLALVLPVGRLSDVFVLMAKFNIKPKRLQFLFPRVESKPTLVLIEGRFRVGDGINFLPNLYLHPDDLSDHSYNNKIKKLYKPLKYKEKI